MELIANTIRDIAVGNRVRMGFCGSLPVFSVGDVINLVSGREQFSMYGNNFVNTTIKQRYPDLFDSIIPHKFARTSKETPCMDMFAILKAISTMNCEFGQKLQEVAAAGILQLEAGDEGLLEYVMRSASSESMYHRLLRQILWAKKNPEEARSSTYQEVDQTDDPMLVQVWVVFICV
jgi:hypothetical protein